MTKHRNSPGMAPAADAVDRRRVLLGASAALVAGPIAWPGEAAAQPGPHRHSIRIGQADVTVLSDGTMPMPMSFVLPGRPRQEIEAAFKSHGRPLNDPGQLQVNIALIRLGSELILVDTGAGPDFAPQRGNLADRLDTAGIKREAITKVVFTHAHPDHLWGISDPFDGASIFPNARLFMTAAERDYWLRGDVESKVPESMRGAAIGTRRRLRQLGDKIEIAKVGAEIVPGIALLDTVGHSPGHASVILKSGGAQLLICGDVLTEATVSFARPDWRWGADWDAEAGIRARRRVLDILTADKMTLLGYHLPWPGIGRAEPHQGTWRFVQT